MQSIVEGLCVVDSRLYFTKKPLAIQLISTLEKQDFIFEIGILYFYKIHEKFVKEWLKKLKHITLTIIQEGNDFIAY